MHPAGFFVYPLMTVALSPWSEQLFVVVVVGIVPVAKEALESMRGLAQFHRHASDAAS